jgi:hypothetical protein
MPSISNLKTRAQIAGNAASDGGAKQLAQVVVELCKKMEDMERATKDATTKAARALSEARR